MEGQPQTWAFLQGRTCHLGLQSMIEEPGGFRAPHEWECLTVQGEAPRDLDLLQPQ